MTFILRRKRKSNNQNLIKLINITFFRRAGKLSNQTAEVYTLLEGACSSNPLAPGWITLSTG